jgi:hypothetical protein
MFSYLVYRLYKLFFEEQDMSIFALNSLLQQYIPALKVCYATFWRVGFNGRNEDGWTRFTVKSFLLQKQNVS